MNKLIEYFLKWLLGSCYNCSDRSAEYEWLLNNAVEECIWHPCYLCPMAVVDIDMEEGNDA